MIYNNIAFSLYSSLLSIQYFELGSSKYRIERKELLLKIFYVNYIDYFVIKDRQRDV